MKKPSFSLFLLVIISLNTSAFHPEKAKTPSDNHSASQSQCTNPTAKVELDMYNVRTTILTGGDMWWDLMAPQYEVPKGCGRNSMSAGGLWIGGMDENLQLRIAAQTYRQIGNDYWPGPLDTTNASINNWVCNEYDKIWKVNRKEVADFKDGKVSASNDINTWPGNGDAAQGQAHYLAPFKDLNGNGIYEPALGEYPNFEFNGDDHYSLCDKTTLPGDQALWWVINDKGDIHHQTLGQQIGVEIQAIAFVMDNGNNDEDFKNATFYRYKIINRGNITLNQTYMGIYADPDLDNPNDDYLGCEADLGLGYCYYSDNPFNDTTTSIGLDYLEGPLADADGLDNPTSDTRSGTGYSDGIVDNEHLGLSKFMYFNNDNTVTGNPQIASDYYRYLMAIWKDGKAMTYGGTGHGSGSGSTSEPCDFMFPGNTDTKNGTRADWTEITAGNTPLDRRFIASTGPLTLKPGSVYFTTFAVVWAQAKGSSGAAVYAIKQADIKIQAVFNSCMSSYSLGVKDLSLKSAESIAFPNPFSTQTQIYINPVVVKNNSLLRILDVTGRCVKVLYNLQPGYITVDRDGLTAGTYLYQIENNNKPVSQGKLVIE